MTSFPPSESGTQEARIAREHSIATDVYWIMPGPRQFCRSVSNAVLEHRWLAIRTTAFPPNGFSSAIDGAIRGVHLDNEQARWIRLTEQGDLDAAIGAQFGRGAMYPGDLAHAVGPIRTIVVEATNEVAATRSIQYLRGFSEAAGRAARERGQTSLLLILPRSMESLEAPISDGAQDMVFSGALTQEEMQAYVSVRMSGRSGPGSTGLLRMLVSEFAGFDAQLAEKLIDLSDPLLLDLPNSLGPISAQSDHRWRTGRWAAGCFADVSGLRTSHVLHELYLSRHEGPLQRSALANLRRRYWRACLRSLLPWLEERKGRVIEVLRPALETHLSSTGGKAVRVTASGYRIETPIDELEINQIPALVNHEGLSATNASQQLAIDVCFSAKRVRDAMAHMRPPGAPNVLEMIDLTERLLGP